MFVYRFQPLPNLGGAYFVRRDGAMILGGRIISRHEIWTRQKKLEDKNICPQSLQTVLSLGDELRAGAWPSVTRLFRRGVHTHSRLTSLIWAVGYANPGRRFEVWHGGQTVAWQCDLDHITCWINDTHTAFNASLIQSGLLDL